MSNTCDKTEYVLKCKDCNRFFKSYKELQAHVKVIHDVQCQLYDKSFGSVKEMEYHDRIEHLAKKCPYCDKLYLSDEHIQQHIKYKHHFQCELCDQYFFSYEQLDHHDRYVHLTIECPNCNKLFFRSDLDLLNHIQREHLDFCCHVCSKWFYSRELKNFHVRQKHQTFYAFE